MASYISDWQKRVASNLQHYPLANNASVDQASITVPLTTNVFVSQPSAPPAPSTITTINEKLMFKRRINFYYPLTFIIFTTVAILVLNGIILNSRIFRDYSKVNYVSFDFFVSVYSMTTSFFNCLYASLGLLSSKLNKNKKN